MGNGQGDVIIHPHQFGFFHCHRAIVGDRDTGDKHTDPHAQGPCYYTKLVSALPGGRLAEKRPLHRVAE